jgi:hypothetical protein
MALSDILLESEKFTPDVDSTFEASPDGTEMLFSQLGSANPKFTTQSIGELGGNMRVGPTDPAVGTFIDKMSADSEIVVTSDITDPLNHKFKLSVANQINTNPSLNALIVPGNFMMDPSLGDPPSGYTGFPPKLNLVPALTYMTRSSLKVREVTNGFQQVLTVPVAVSTGYISVKVFQREYTSFWSPWSEATASTVYRTTTRDLNAIIYEGQYNLIVNGPNGDETDYTNLPGASLVSTVASDALLYALLADASLSVVSLETGATSRYQQILDVPVGVEHHRFIRSYVSGTWLAWFYLDNSGGGGGGTDDQTSAEVSYDPAASNLLAATAQAAIDEVVTLYSKVRVKDPTFAVVVTKQGPDAVVVTLVAGLLTISTGTKTLISGFRFFGDSTTDLVGGAITVSMVGGKGSGTNYNTSDLDTYHPTITVGNRSVIPGQNFLQRPDDANDSRNIYGVAFSTSGTASVVIDGLNGLFTLLGNQ